MTQDQLRQSPMAIAYSYLRCSTPEQLQGDSFRRQAKASADYARDHGLTLDNSLVLEDRGVSAFRGANFETGALGHFLRLVENGTIAQGSYLLVESLDRISRQSARKALRILEEIVEAGVVVVTMVDRVEYTAESFEKDPLNFLRAFFVLMRSSEESTTKSLRVGQAWERKRSLAYEHLTAMTAACPGWLHVVDGRYVAIGERADVVRRMFDWAIAGEGKRAIAAKLNRSGVAPWGRVKKIKNGHTLPARELRWHDSYIQKILTNPAVFGRFSPRGGRDSPIEGYYPAVVPNEIFWLAQAASEQRRTSNVRTPPGQGKNLFSGLLFCSCGAGLHLVDKGAKSSGPTLVCGGYRTSTGCQNSARFPYFETEFILVYQAFETENGGFAGDGAQADAKSDQRLAARLRFENAERRLASITEAIAAGAGRTLAAAHSTAEREVAEAGALVAHAETSARVITSAQNAIDGAIAIYQRLFDAKSLAEALAWRRELASAIRSTIQRVTFHQHQMELEWRGSGRKERIPFDSLTRREEGATSVRRSNAGWFVGITDSAGRPLRREQQSNDENSTVGQKLAVHLARLARNSHPADDGGVVRPAD